MSSNVATRKRRGNNCDEQVVLNKSPKLKDQAAAGSKEKSLKGHSNAVDEDEIVVIYDSSSNSASNQNGDSLNSDALSIKSNTSSINSNHTDCNTLNVNDSRNLNPDVIDTNNNSKDGQNSVGSCKSTSQNVHSNLSSNENKENLFIYTSNCRNKQSENGMKDGRTRVGSRKATSNANSTITMEQYYAAIESNQNDASLSSSPYLVGNSDGAIKMEEELQITDTNTDAVSTSINGFSMSIVSPIAFEQIRQQPKTEFSEEDVVTLSDTEEDTVPYLDLFDEYRKKTFMNQEVDEKVRKVETTVESKDAGISSYASGNRDGGFPYHQSIDRLDTNTLMNQEVDEEMIKVEAKVEPEDAGISSYASGNRDGGFPYHQSIDRLDTNTLMNQEVDEEMIKVEAKVEPEDAGISSYASGNRDGGFPYHQSIDRLDTNTLMNQEVDEEMIKVEAKVEPEGAGISSYASGNRDGGFPYHQSIDRLDTNTLMNQEVDEEMIKVEAKVEPEDAGISSYASGNRDGGFPYHQSIDRLDTNTLMNQEVDEEMIKVEAKVEPEGAGISSYASDNRDGSFPYHQSIDRLDTNTLMNQEIDEEMIKVETKVEPEVAGISSYASDNRDGSFPYHQSIDRLDMNTWMNQEIDEEMIKVETKVEPEVAGISSYASDNRDGSFPYHESFDRLDMNTLMNQDVDEEVREEEAETVPEDSGISSYASDNRDGSFPYRRSLDRFDVNTSMNQQVDEEMRGISLYGNADVVDSSSDSCDEDYRNWMRKLSRSRTLNEDEIQKEVKNDNVAQRKVGHALDKSADKPPLDMTERLKADNEMEIDAVDRVISLKKSTSTSTIIRKKSFINITFSSLGSRRQENDSCPTNSTTIRTVTRNQKSLVRKVLQTEPLHLPTRRRNNRAKQDSEKPPKEKLSIKEKKELKEIEDQKKDQKKFRTQNESPDCLPPSKKKASPLTKVEKEQLMYDRKKELEGKGQKKRSKARNESPDCLPPSKKKASPLTKVEKEQLMYDRKKELEEKGQKKRSKARDESPGCLPPSKKKASLLTKVVKEQLMDDRKKELKKKDQKKCRAQKTSPLTKEEKKQLMADRKQKLMQIALNERLSSHNNSENNSEKKCKTPNVKNTISARKLKDAEEKPKSINLPAVVNDILASPMSQEIKDIESTSRRVEVAKYKSTKPVIIASSFLKSTEKIMIKVDESNMLNRLARKEASMPRKSMNDEMLNYFLLRIFKCHPNWLNEQKDELRFDRTAPVVSFDELREILPLYKSYAEYYRTMLPRLLLKTWFEITQSYASTVNCEQHKCWIIQGSIQMETLSSNLQLTTLMLEVLVTREDLKKKAYPNEGDLVFFEYPSIEQEGEIFVKGFAYVDDDHTTILSNNTHYNKELEKYVSTPYALKTYTIRTKPLRAGILVNRVGKISCVSKFRANLNMAQALEYLPKSPLMNWILSPKIEEYCLPTVPIHSEQLFTRQKLNKTQLEAVLKVTETIVQNQTKLCFIQGPSGTGKSTVIVNILSQVLYRKKRYTSSEGALKILVCAPTNAAIDEITLRLLQIRSSTKQNWFNIVRIGQTGVKDPIVRNITVTVLAKQEINRTRTISENLISLKCKMANTHNMCDCGEQMKMTRLNKKDSVSVQQDAEIAVLSQADIITCTLSAMYSKQTEHLMNKKGISVCIIDEATQITEAETLMPLMLGVNTLVLVGDSNEQPVAVPSPRGKIEGRDQSIFSRVQNAFEMNPVNPIIMLDTQYRMSRDIWQWPSKFFYAGNLDTCTLPNDEFPFHSYRLFNIHNSVPQCYANIAEAQFVANMIYTMLTQTNFDGWECISYGILTPYNNQKHVIQEKIYDKLSLLPENARSRIKFEVSTFDGFRGKERDVVILSCVRGQRMGCLSDMHRLRVALTRAKHSMIICGAIGLFNKDPNWNSLLSDAKSRNVYFDVDVAAESWEIKQHVVKRCRCR